MRFFWRKKAAALPSFQARPVQINPDDEEQRRFAVYRADAIARDIEQRREEGREKHGQHDQIVAEALAYGYAAVAAGVWSRHDLARLEARLKG